MPAQPAGGADAERGARHDRVAVEGSHVLVDGDQGGHHLAELVEGELLLGVGQRLVRARMDLDHDPVRPDRDAADGELMAALDSAYARILAAGVTTLEVKSGYGLTPEHELHQLELLDQSRAITPLSLVISYLGAHVVPEGVSADAYTSEVLETLPAVIDQGIATFHDITCEAGLFTPEQATAMFKASRNRGIPTKAHADAWTSSHGWETAVAGGAVSAEHLTRVRTQGCRRP